MALTHAYIRATKGTEKPDAASPTTLLQKVNDARRASEPGLPPGDEGQPRGDAAAPPAALPSRSHRCSRPIPRARARRSRR